MFSRTVKFRISIFLSIILTVLLLSNCTDSYKNNLSQEEVNDLNSILSMAGKNAPQLDAALSNCQPDHLKGLFFLLKNMPERDLKKLTSEYLLENVEYSYRVMSEVKWGNQIPEDIFLNYILPYANLHERRDNWRKDFYTRFLNLVVNLDTPSEAVLKLNQEIWDIVNVHYSTKRPKADQSPYESIEVGMASCTGLSILLIDVCRAVGIPARFVGVPLWKDESGNHSWVEIWDNGWHYIGAAEQSPLNETWFGERAKTSDDSEWKYSIYAVSFKKTDVVFPPLFDSTATYVYADIVTDKYSEKIKDDGKAIVGIRLFDTIGGERVIGTVKIFMDGKIIAQGETKDEKYDFNDFLMFSLQPNTKYEFTAESNGREISKDILVNDKKYQFLNIYLNEH